LKTGSSFLSFFQKVRSVFSSFFWSVFAKQTEIKSNFVRPAQSRTKEKARGR